MHILFPPDGSRLDLAIADGTADVVPLKVAGAVGALTVLVNGIPTQAQRPGAVFFKPAGPGFSRVTVMDSSGAAASVVVRVDDSAAAEARVRPAGAICTGAACRLSDRAPAQPPR